LGIVAREPSTREHAFAINLSGAAIVESNFNGSRIDEPAFARDQFHTARRRALGVHLMQPFYHLAFTALDSRHADRERIRFKSEFRTAPGQ
jgi:hypothetical protein